MQKIKETEVTIKFVGDSGDGMQLTGSLFTDNTALTGSDLATFPDFPAEIRAPQGTLAGVSGFQLHFGSREIFTPGDKCDVLVAMNAAALKSTLKNLKSGGTLIINTDGFDHKNLKLAGYGDANPLEDEKLLRSYASLLIPITKLTKEALKDSPIGTKDKERCKNMFVLGFLFWRYNRNQDSAIRALEKKFAKNKDLLDANLTVLKAGFNYGDTTETFTETYTVDPAKVPPGTYRNIMGNEALVLGLLTAADKSGLELFYGSYPITPASDILHQLSGYRNFGVKTFQAEDEISAIGAAIGASYGGNLAVTGTSGPGMALKTEAMGLAIMLELPLIICNIQRGGPSTGLPTKTEQADLLQAIYGRNGEAPIPVIAASSPSDCFETAIEAARIAVEHMTPVILLSDGYIANGAEPWKIPDISQIKNIVPVKPSGDFYLPYKRNEKLVRAWATPGTPNLAHRLGGLEKEAETGNVSYDPANHEYMVKIRQQKVDWIARDFKPLEMSQGENSGEFLLLGWGSTKGVLSSVAKELIEEGWSISHLHLRHLNPLHHDLGDFIQNFRHVIIPEINNGQLVKIIRDKFLIPAISYCKIQGVPITKSELKGFMLSLKKEEV
jgi:2-oxoglutarate/2-oxoacid ferredoxin oxidoreductase subunit alpha